MTVRPSSCQYNYVNPTLANTLQSASVTNRIFHPNLLQLACESVIDLLATPKDVHFDPLAKACVVENIFDYVTYLCVPSIPLTVTELCVRVCAALPFKLKPGDKQLDEYRLQAEKRGRKRRSNLAVADKVISNMKGIDSRIDNSTATLFVQVTEHIINCIVQTALNYQTELGFPLERTISSIDIQHIRSLLGTPSDDVGPDWPFIKRNTDTYEGCLRDLQTFLKTSNKHLNIVTRIFLEPLMRVLPGLTSTTINSDTVALAASSALAVLKAARSLANDLNILSEVADDVFDSNAHLFNYCLQEPAEEDLYQGFAYYAEVLFSVDCSQWVTVLSETPEVFSCLVRSHRRMVTTIFKQVSIRRLPDLELRFADPHACKLCTSITPEPIMPSSVATSTPPTGLFFRPVFRKFSSTTARPLRQQGAISASSSSSGERSPPGPFLVHGGGVQSTELIYGGGSRTCSQMVIAFRYLLPRLLLMPVYQILYLADLLDELRMHPQVDAQEQSILLEASSMLFKTRKAVMFELNNATTKTSSWVQSHLPRLHLLLETPLSTRPVSLLSAEARSRLSTVIQAARNNDEVSRLSLSPVNFIMSGVVQLRQNPSKSGLSDRVAYLFSDCLLLFKRQSQQRWTVGSSAVATAVALISNSGGGGGAASGSASGASASAAQPPPSFIISGGGGSSAGCSSSGAATSTPSGTSGGGGLPSLVLKKAVPLVHFHLIDLGMLVNPEDGEPMFLFELEYWRNVTAVARRLCSKAPSDDQHDLDQEHQNKALQHSPTTYCTSSLPKQASVTSLSTLTPATVTRLHRRLPGSSTTLNTIADDSCCEATTEAMADSAGPAKRVVFCLKSADEKTDWLGTLVGIQRRGLFHRYLHELPKQEIPLILPDPETYCFSQPDSPANILFEAPRTDSSAEMGVIRAATLAKLVERITSHACFDSKTIRTFLQTYRRYVSPSGLLELLIQRFNMPRPNFDRELYTSLAEHIVVNDGSQSNTTSGGRKRSFSDVASLLPRMELRFNSAYKRRIQYRVLSFIKKWVRHPGFYTHDFANDLDLQARLCDFLEGISKVPSLVEIVSATLRSLRGDRGRVVQIIRQCPPEKLDLRLALTFDQVRLTNVHPLEFARQVTLYEWELYSKIEFWEVNGNEKCWGPNMRLSREFSEKFLKWLIWSIMSHKSMDDRVIVLQRVLDLLLIFQSLSNLQGTQEARAALLTSPVHRLSYTFDALFSKSRSHHRALLESLRPAGESEDTMLASPEGYIDDYQHRVHRIDPPAVPFIAVGGQTQLIHLELKLPDYIPGGTQKEPLVNFSKCQQISDLKEHYLSFQNIPFNLKADPIVQDFLKKMNPLALSGASGEGEFEDLMFQQSIAIQPREGATIDAGTKQEQMDDASMNRQLTPLEMRIGPMLSASPIDAHTLADSKEFRQLVAITSVAPEAKFRLFRAETPPLLPERGLPGSVVRESSGGRGTVRDAPPGACPPCALPPEPGGGTPQRPDTPDTAASASAAKVAVASPPPLPPKPPSHTEDHHQPPLSLMLGGAAIVYSSATSPPPVPPPRTETTPTTPFGSPTAKSFYPFNPELDSPIPAVAAAATTETGNRAYINSDKQQQQFVPAYQRSTASMERWRRLSCTRSANTASAPPITTSDTAVAAPSPYLQMPQSPPTTKPTSDQLDGSAAPSLPPRSAMQRSLQPTPPLQTRSSPVSVDCHTASPSLYPPPLPPKRGSALPRPSSPCPSRVPLL